MRIAFALIILATTIGCGTDRSAPGFTSPATSGGRSALALRVVDDPNGAVDVTSASTRPTVSLVFEATGQGTTSFSFTGAGQVQMSVPVDSSQTMSTLLVDNVPAARFDRLALRLVSARLAIPGDRVPSRDMLGGSAPVVQRAISLDLRSAARTLVIDLNSAQWLRKIPNPPLGEPPYAFEGADAFLRAIAVQTP